MGLDDRDVFVFDMAETIGILVALTAARHDLEARPYVSTSLVAMLREQSDMVQGRILKQ